MEAGLFSVPSLRLSTGICPLCPLCRPLNALIYCMLTPVEFSNKASTFWIISVVGKVRSELSFSAMLAKAECGLTSNLCGVRAYQSRSFTSFCLSASRHFWSYSLLQSHCFLLLSYDDIFTSLTCTNSYRIQLRANHSWIDVMLKWALNLIVAGYRKPSWLVDLHRLLPLYLHPLPPDSSEKEHLSVWHLIDVGDEDLLIQPQMNLSATCVF